MADAEARIAPIINEIFYVTAEFGQYPSGGPHNGVDISTGKNSNLYSIVNGIITNKGYDASRMGKLYLYERLNYKSRFFIWTYERSFSIKCG